METDVAVDDSVYCYKCRAKLEPNNRFSLRGLYYCATEQDKCRRQQAARGLAPDEQKQADQLFEVYQKMRQHSKDVENGVIPDTERLKLPPIPSKLRGAFDQLLRNVWAKNDETYDPYTHTFRYQKYVKGKYRDGGSGPHYVQWIGDDSFKLDPRNFI